MGVHENQEIQMPEVIDIVPYRNFVCNYITYDVPTRPHKTRRQSHTAFSIYTFQNSDLKQRDGEKDQHECLFICSEFLYTHYLHII